MLILLGRMFHFVTGHLTILKEVNYGQKGGATRDTGLAHCVVGLSMREAERALFQSAAITWKQCGSISTQLSLGVSMAKMSDSV
jgi:hypothetical protein